MNKLSATSSQRKPRDEIGQENNSIETIWAEIYHDKNGKTVLKNIPRERNVQNLDLEDSFFEDERNLRLTPQKIIFIKPKKVDEEDSSTKNNSSSTQGLTSKDCDSQDRENCDMYDPWSFEPTKREPFMMTDLSGNILDRKDENPNLLKPSCSVKRQPNCNPTKRLDVLLNTLSFEKARKHKSNPKALLQNWLTSSSSTNRLKTRSTEAFKPDEQDSKTFETQLESLGKRIKNAICQKDLLAISSGFKVISKTPVVELDAISRPSRAQKSEEILKDSCAQPDRGCVYKKYGTKAERYFVGDEMGSSTEPEVEAITPCLTDVGTTFSDDETGTCQSNWSKLKFWKGGLFPSRKTVSPQISQDDYIDHVNCDAGKPNRNVRVADYYKMIEKGSCIRNLKPN